MSVATVLSKYRPLMELPDETEIGLSLSQDGSQFFMGPLSETPSDESTCEMAVALAGLPTDVLARYKGQPKEPGFIACVAFVEAVKLHCGGYSPGLLKPRGLATFERLPFAHKSWNVVHTPRLLKARDIKIVLKGFEYRQCQCEEYARAYAERTKDVLKHFPSCTAVSALFTDTFKQNLLAALIPLTGRANNMPQQQLSLIKDLVITHCTYINPLQGDPEEDQQVIDTIITELQRLLGLPNTKRRYLSSSYVTLSKSFDGMIILSPDNPDFQQALLTFSLELYRLNNRMNLNTSLPHNFASQLSDHLTRTAFLAGKIPSGTDASRAALARLISSLSFISNETVGKSKISNLDSRTIGIADTASRVCGGLFHRDHRRNHRPFHMINAAHKKIAEDAQHLAETYSPGSNDLTNTLIRAIQKL